MLMLALLLQTATTTAPAAADPTVKANKKYDPNRMICRTEETTGSRLGSQKRCLTAAQWTEHNREERLTVDRYQRMGRPDGGG